TYCAFSCHGHYRHLHSFPTRRSSDLLALVEQQAGTDLDITVLDVVLLGRTPHHSAMQGENAHDLELARDALVAVGMLGFVERSRSEEHTSELQSRENLVCRLLLEKKK